MSEPFVYFVGTREQVGHHAAPLQPLLPIDFATIDELDQRLQPGDIAVFVSEHFEESREAIERCKQRRVATVYAIDGILEWRNAWDNLPTEKSCPWTMRPCLCDKVVAIGPSQARVLASWGNRSKIELIGVPRFDRLWQSRPTLEAIEQRLSATIDAGSTSPASRPLRVMVVTAKCPGFTPEQLARTTQSLEDLRDFFGASNSSANGVVYEPIWRLTAGLDRELGVRTEIADLTGADFATQLASSDVVISTASTAILEAMLMGKPVALLDYHMVPQLVSTAWQINAPQQIESVLRSMQLGTALDRRRMAWQEHLLYDSLHPTPHAARAMSELLTEMRSVALQCMAQNQPLAFPERIISEQAAQRLSAVEQTTIDHAAMVPRIAPEWLYPEYPEFDCNDQWLLRSELAQARRELRYVRADLAQAHRILERWQSLPVIKQLLRLGSWWQEKRETRRKSRITTAPQATSSQGAREGAR